MGDEGVHVTNRAEIDTSAPFRSVKEAVMLFGDRVLASEVYGSRLRELQVLEETAIMEYANVTLEELEEAKQSLRKAREERAQMATTLFFLQQELEQTKIELQQLKISTSDHRPQRHRCLELDSDVLEDIKFVEEDSTRLIESDRRRVIKNHDREIKPGFQRKKYVRFASPPCAARVVVLPNDPPSVDDENLPQRQPSIRKKKNKKRVIEFIRRVFTKRSGSSEVGLA